MKGAADFRQLLEAGDVDALRKAWHRVAPTMPQPRSREEAEITMHHARTQSETICFNQRAYSHAWLTERGLPSGLPDHLKPRAERAYPRVAEAVGISINYSSKLLAPAAAEVRVAMSDAVEECFADGRREPEFIKQRMLSAQERTLHALFGRR